MFQITVTIFLSLDFKFETNFYILYTNDFLDKINNCYAIKNIFLKGTQLIIDYSKMISSCRNYIK